MNERIRELMPKPWTFPYPDRELYTKEQFENFAELIVQECARVARATPAPNFHEHLKQQLGHTWDMACVESGRQIVEHFGVEK
jgi:hypothetical protein